MLQFCNCYILNIILYICTILLYNITYYDIIQTRVLLILVTSHNNNDNNNDNDNNDNDNDNDSYSDNNDNSK